MVDNRNLPRIVSIFIQHLTALIGIIAQVLILVLRTSPRVPKTVSQSRNFSKIKITHLKLLSNPSLNLLALEKKPPHTRKVARVYRCPNLEVEGHGEDKK